MKNLTVSEIKVELSEFLIPDLCIMCRRNVVDAGEAVCADCAKRLAYEQRRICIRCGAASRLCQCGKPKKAETVKSVFWYRGIAKKYILYMKRNRIERQYGYAASRMSALISEDKELSSCDTIAYIPRSSRRAKALGVDHSYELAKRISENTGIPLGHFIVAPKKLREQKSLSARERLRNVRNAYSASDKKPPERVLLIDDVFTTGATAGECVRVLVKSGAKKVYCVFLGKTR